MKILRHITNEIVRSDAAKSQRTIEGYAAVFDSKVDLGMFTESISPGAFADAIARPDDVRALIDHNPTLIIGRVPDTLALREDNKGLFYSVTPPDTQIARDLVTNIASGLITQSSFGFIIEQEKVDRTGSKTHFTIEKVRLFDVSPVTFPAYPDTAVGVARSEARSDQELVERLRVHIDESEAIKIRKELRERLLALTKVCI